MTVPQIQSEVYLDVLLKQFIAQGGNVKQRKITSFDEVIINTIRHSATHYLVRNNCRYNEDE